MNYLGKNVFLNDVYEKDGIRRIFKNGFEIIEKEPAFEFARALNKTHSQMLLSNMFKKEFLESYGRSLNKIYATFFQNNQFVKDELYQKFLLKQKEEMANLFIKVWFKKLKVDYSHIEWKSWISLKNSSAFPLGLQYGLGQLLKNKNVVELGLDSDLNACSVHSIKKDIFTKKQEVKDYAPFSYLDKEQEKSILNVDKASFKNKEKTLRDLFTLTPYKNLLNEDYIKVIWSKSKQENQQWKAIIDKYALKQVLLVSLTDDDFPVKKQIIQDEQNYYIWNFDKPQSLSIKALIDFAPNNLWGLEEITEEYDNGRKPYQAVSQISEPTGMVSTKIAEEIHQALMQIQQEHNLDEWVASLLQIPKEELKNRLSSEQVDAIALAITSLEKNKGLIIADETGFGKGRILAAIAIIGLNQGKNVFFFTENKQLFSDFYRDLFAVKQEKIIPQLLNQSGKIYDPNGELIVNHQSQKAFKKMIEDKEWTVEEHLLITNYAQINKKERTKMEFLKALKPDWIILDEAHNASGNSNINENLKELIKDTGVIFSSATYAKTEEKLSIYDKAIPLSETAKNLVKLALSGDGGDLRELITKEMAKQGNYIRREHPPIELPEITFIDNEEIHQRTAQFSEMWKAIFALAEIKEEMLGYFSAKAWLKLGSILARSIREFVFLNKIEGVSNIIEEKIKQDEKVVLVTEITFESMLKDLVDGTFNLDEDDKESEEEKKLKEISFDEKPNWCWKWLALLDKLCDPLAMEKELFYRKKDPNFDLTKYNNLMPTFLEQKQRTEEVILTNNYFGLSPLDELKENLKAKKITLTELSGRTYQLIQQKDKWVINNKLEKKERTELVHDFNQGVNDVILVTRSGASGISLHAGEKFKDQRKRNLIELDIASNSANRIQFLGRVRRKDQVVEPNFYTPLLRLPSDIRKMEVEKRKQIKLSAHVGGRRENKVLDWVSEEGEMIIEEWGKENKDWAKKIGAFHAGDETKRIDRALTRSLILPKEIQDVLFKRIEKGIESHTDFHFYKNISLPTSEVIYSHFLWGNEQTKTATEADNSILNLGYITANYRLWKLKQVNFEQTQEVVKKVEKYILQNPFQSKLETLYEKWQQVIDITDNKYSVNALNATKNFFNNHKQGQLFALTFKNLFKKVGCIVDVILPNVQEVENTYDQAVEMISAYCLNNILVKVLFENDLKTVNVPLYILLKDNTFQTLSYTLFNIKQFYKSDLYLNSITIEGNPILFSVWNKKTNLGKIEVIHDEEGSKTILLPKVKKIEELNIYPFIGSGQISDFLHSHIKDGVSLPIFNHYENEKATIAMRMIRNQFNKTEIEITYKDVKEYQRHSSGWVLKAHRFIKDRVQKREQMALYASAGKLFQILTLMQEQGIHFFCQDNEWLLKNMKKHIPSF